MTKGKKPRIEGSRTSGRKAKTKEEAKLNGKIGRLKAKLKHARSIEAEEETEEVKKNAGDQFGGRKKKKENKSS